ncbi:hypothetical protein D9M69_721660 [compost metagenome]
MANEVPMHSEAIAPIRDSVGSRVDGEAARPVFKVAAVMAGKGKTRCGRSGAGDQGARVSAVE